MKKSYSLNTFLPLLLFLAVAIVVLVFFVAPSIFKAVKTYQEMGGLRRKVLELSKKSDALANINKEEIKDKYDRLNYYLPSNKDVSVLMDSISSMTSQTGMTFESLRLAPGELATPSATQANRDLFSLEVAISLNGDFASLVNFIKNVSKASPVVRLETISADKKFSATSDGSLNPYTFEVKLVTYYKPLPVSMGNVTEKVATISAEDVEFITSLPRAPVSVSVEDTGDQNINSGRLDPFARF